MIKNFLIISLLGIALSNALSQPNRSIKISNGLLRTLESKGSANAVISFTEETQPILDRVNRMRFETRGHKITFMKTQLEELAKESQKNVISVLKSRSVASSLKFQSFWINNRIIVKGADVELILNIAEYPEVSEIREEQILHILDNIKEGIPTNTSQEEVEWGIERIEANLAWSLVGGNTGQGVVVANIDTGVKYTHEALRGNYRTPYGWFDAYHRTPNPNDLDGHGTHTMGTIAGSHGIGVAPGAQWAACRGCDEEGCTETALNGCGEWVICPTLWNTQQPDCSKAPQIVSNSWGGGSGNTFYEPVVNAWRAASIIPIFAAGNSGSSCATANSPGDYETVIGVGATHIDEVIATFSSRGPTYDGRIKPDVSAPGNNVRSSCFDSDTAYCTLSGTSMACPHVAGAAALLLAKNPDLTFDQVKDLLQDNADRELHFAEECGGTYYNYYPNNIYGFGRINARRSLTALIESS
ncbi:unnamed protein product [Orchesella dallaii]|uniref:Peptidase S8/S53 domain-containing protein n=1 Tax=Orchesella dallaii TaxID=48710 RepID=A0ABP1QIL0_9HEXA